MLLTFLYSKQNCAVYDELFQNSPVCQNRIICHTNADFQGFNRDFFPKINTDDYQSFIVVLLADAVENIYLLQITAMYTPDISDAELIPVLKNLHIVTWIKWGGLALIFALYSVKTIGKRFLSHIEVVVFVFPFILIFWAVSNDPIGVSRFTLSIALSFFLLLFYCFWHKTKKIEKYKKKIAVS
jgi:hypothetical protein